MQAQAFFDDSDKRFDTNLITLFTTIVGLASFLLAGLVITGWIPLGERANISRRDINTLETIVIIGGIAFGLAAVRTLYSLLREEKEAIPWAQWLSLGAVAGSFVIALYALGGLTNATERAFMPVTFFLAWLLLVGSLTAYMSVTKDYDGTPHQFIGLQIAETPSAGAIIGFLFLFFFFGVTADLFFQPSSIASVLTNSASKGVIAIGVTMLMISGEFDLSVGSILGVSAMVFVMVQTPEGLALFGVQWIGTQPVGIALIITLVAACAMGLVNGLLLIWTRIPSFIVTLGTLFAFRAISLVGIAGGRIIRYRDYYATFPQVYVDRWLMVLLPVILGGFLAFVMYQAAVSNGRRTVSLLRGEVSEDMHVRELSYDITPFKTTLGVLSGLWTLIQVLTFASITLWLLLVAYMNARHIERADGLGYTVATVVSFAFAFYIFGWVRRTWNAFIEKRALIRREIANSKGADTSPAPAVSTTLKVVGRILLYIFGVTVIPIVIYFFRRQILNGLRFAADALRYGRTFLLALLIFLLVIGAFFLATNQLFVERADSYQIDAFTISNGRWIFTGESVTEPLDGTLIDSAANLVGVDFPLMINIPTGANFRNAIVWWFLLVLFFQIILTKTSYGNATFAVGGNVGAARAQGINVNRIKVQNFVLVAFLCGLAAVMEVARNPSVDPLKGNTWELEVIAMTVVGGALLTGGYGSIFGTMLGAIIFGMLSTGLILLNVNSRALQGVIGVTLIVAVILNNASKRIRN